MIYINNEKEFLNEQTIQICKEKCELEYNFAHYYKKICNSYQNRIELLEQMEKDIPRLDVYIQNRRVYSLYQLLHYFEQLLQKYEILYKKNNQLTFSKNELTKWFYLINQSVFGLNFYIMNKLYSDISNEIYVIDKSNSEKTISIQFYPKRVLYQLKHQFYIIQLQKQGNSKILNTLCCHMILQSNNNEFPNTIQIQWTKE